MSIDQNDIIKFVAIFDTAKPVFRSSKNGSNLGPGQFSSQSRM